MPAAGAAGGGSSGGGMIPIIGAAVAAIVFHLVLCWYGTRRGRQVRIAPKKLSSKKKLKHISEYEDHPKSAGIANPSAPKSGHTIVHFHETE